LTFHAFFLGYLNIQEPAPFQGALIRLAVARALSDLHIGKDCKHPLSAYFALAFLNRLLADQYWPAEFAVLGKRLLKSIKS
jgi:hypothetical protein